MVTMNFFLTKNLKLAFIKERLHIQELLPFYSWSTPLYFSTRLMEIFLTPGLFDMEGIMFWKAFLFELPFALMRAVSPFIFLILAVMFLYAYSNLNKAKKEIENDL